MVRIADERLALVDKLTQRSVLSSVEEVARGRHLAAPLVVELDPTSHCDLACPECISGPLLQNGQFSSPRLLTLAEELIEAGVRAVILIGGGEPLLHPAASDLIEILHGGGIAIGLTTNGTLIDRHIGAIARCVSWTRVSVDAGTAGTYDQFRPTRNGRSSFDTVVKNMLLLGREKDGQLGFSFLVMTRRTADGGWQTNAYEVLQAAKLAKEIGCDYFEVKPEYDLGHFLLDQPDEVRFQLQSQLASLRALDDSEFSVIAPTHLDRVLEGVELRQPKSYHHCPVSELRTLITCRGAFICPYHRGKNHARYGDPQTESFESMWNGRNRSAVVDEIDPSVDCQFNCIRHASNEFILSLDQATGTDVDAVDDFDPFL